MVKTIRYERIELIRPDNYNELIEDLSERTGFDIIKAEVGDINFLNDTATIKIFYREDRERGPVAAGQHLNSK